MNQEKAKAIRKKVYGDYSHRSREYVKDENGAIRNTGLRWQYLQEKKAR
jgi:hypothetical protein